MNESVAEWVAAPIQKKDAPCITLDQIQKKILWNSAVLWQKYETGCPSINGNNEPTLCRNFCAYKCRA